MKERNPALVVVLSIVTCGIYGLYWMYAVTNEIEDTLQARDGSVRSGGMTILLSIVTCGIYTIYWWYKQGKRVVQLGYEAGVTIADNAVLYLVLCFVGIGIYISTALMQSSLNQVVYARNSRPRG